VHQPVTLLQFALFLLEALITGLVSNGSGGNGLLAVFSGLPFLCFGGLVGRLFTKLTKAILNASN
jgi:hypothetical protein